MSHDQLVLQEGAILVADAHYASYRPLFRRLIDQIEKGEIQTTQLVLMGDVFDLLVGHIDRFKRFEKEIIEQLNRLNKKIEIIYLEGNHDFGLVDIFPHMKIVPIENQPIATQFKEQKGWLAHGDWDGTAGYKLYTRVIRKAWILKIINVIDYLLFFSITTLLRRIKSKKVICSKFTSFDQYIEQKFTRNDSYWGWFIEGHYHQGDKLQLKGVIYHNLRAMACNKSYFVVQSIKDEIALLEYEL